MGTSGLARKIRNFRLARKWTQAELATKLGTTPQSVSRWERGDDEPRLVLVSKMASVFGVPVEYFLENAPTKPAKDEKPRESSLWPASQEAARRLSQLRHIATATGMRGNDWGLLASVLNTLEEKLNLKASHADRD